MKVKYWLDSGANIHSKLTRTIDLDIDPEEWNEMTESEQEDHMKDIVFQHLDWGYTAE